MDEFLKNGGIIEAYPSLASRKPINNH